LYLRQREQTSSRRTRRSKIDEFDTGIPLDETDEAFDWDDVEDDETL
jgi:hypothetical protein